MVFGLSRESSPIIDVPPTRIGGEGIPVQIDFLPTPSFESTSSSDITGGSSYDRPVTPKPRPIVAVRIHSLQATENEEEVCVRAIMASSNPCIDEAQPSRSPKTRSILSPRKQSSWLSPSRSSPSRKNQTNSSFGEHGTKKNVGKWSENDLVATSLIAGTENKMRFDFDHVIAPAMSQEQCYARIVGDSIRRNTKRGVDTTIMVLGPNHSGKRHTMDSTWKTRRATGQRLRVEEKLALESGILPRAVHDLFLAYNERESASLKGQNRKILYMSYVVIPSEGGGKHRDLLSRFRHKEKLVTEGVTRVLIKSPDEVKRLLARVTERRASDIRDGKTFHVFINFYLYLDREDVSSDKYASRLSIVKFETSHHFDPDFKPSSDANGDYNLKELLLELTSSRDDANDLLTEDGGGLLLHTRLDTVLKDVSSVIVIGCVASGKAQIGYTTGLLRFLAMATKARYNVFDHGTEHATSLSPLEEKLNFRAVSDTMVVADEGPESHNFLASLQSTLREAEVAARNANESSRSLDLVATKWRSHRDKLNRGSTLAALAKLSKSGANEVSSNEGRDERASPRDKNLTTRDASSIPQVAALVKENITLKASVKRLELENKAQRQEISSLQLQLGDLNKRLLDEKKISESLEGIRDILRRKMSLQDDRLLSLEQAEPHEYKLQENASLEQNRDDSDRSNANLMSLFEEASAGSASVFLFGEDNGSCCSRGFVNMGSPELRPSSFVSQSIRQHSADILEYSSTVTELSALPDELVNCDCQRSFVESGDLEQIDFFLPSLRVSCLCGKSQSRMIQHVDLRLDALLRPWQSKFLAHAGIFHVEHFIETHTEDEMRLAREMTKWRKQEQLSPMPVKACAVALLVWTRACTVVVRRAEASSISFI